jgi:hypothetical protein
MALGDVLGCDHKLRFSHSVVFLYGRGASHVISTDYYLYLSVDKLRTQYKRSHRSRALQRQIRC